MDFLNNNQQASKPVAASPEHAAHHQVSGGKRGDDSRSRRMLNNFVVFMAFAFAVIAIAIAFLFHNASYVPAESRYVNTNKYQAVFLTGGVASGQVLYSTYFGKIVSLNSQYLVLHDIYYLTTSSSTSSSASSNVQLTKLGCQQLHSPYDEMIINRSQVAFWENLQDNGQVAQAITSYQKANPNGPNCSQSTSTTPSSTPSTTSPTSTTPATTSTGH
jgi:hypothetical protein